MGGNNGGHFKINQPKFYMHFTKHPKNLNSKTNRIAKIKNLNATIKKKKYPAVDLIII